MLHAHRCCFTSVCTNSAASAIVLIRCKLTVLQHDPRVGVLVMDETGSVGLDLSFVGWVFLMEPLADASLEAQVTARAHRMGASQAVHVESLVMKVQLTLAGIAC